MEGKILEVKDLSVAFDAQVILEGVNFVVHKRETVAIIGPNGSGKSVLFRALIGAVPFQGTVVWSPNVRLGYVPQRLDLDRHLSLTLRDFLSLKARILRLARPALNDVLELVRLPEHTLHVPLNYLSAGQLQRGLIAFALLGNPNVLLFDEPTAGVDLPGEEQIYHTLHNLQDTQALTVILISHDLNLVYRYADKVLCLNKEMFCFGGPKETLQPQILDQLYRTRVLHHHVGRESHTHE